MKTQMCLLVLTVGSALAAQPVSYQTHEVVPEKELLITNTEVVDSKHATYPGPFSFGHLIEELAGQRGVEAFLSDWAALWETDQEVNGHTIKARPAIHEKLIKPWQEKDGYDPENGGTWEVNLANAPFRLLGIVNRLDLGSGIFVSSQDDVSMTSGSQYYSSQSPEVRFIYGALEPDGTTLAGGFTLILEYGVVFNGRFRNRDIPKQVSQYAAYWHQLGTFDTFDDAYLDALAEVTGVLTERDHPRFLTGLKDSEGNEISLQLAATITRERPNRPSDAIEIETTSPPLLRQMRTNDGSLASTREFRQCQIRRGKLQAAVLSSTPAEVFREEKSPERRKLIRHLNDNERSITNGSHRFPIVIGGRTKHQRVTLAGGSALIPDNDANFHWELDGVDDHEVRRIISMGTCTGCHSGETQTAFFHIAPRAAGEESKISDYLRLDGIRHEISDPARPRVTVKLNEMGQRKAIFMAALDRNMRPSQIRKLLKNRSKHGH